MGFLGTAPKNKVNANGFNERGFKWEHHPINNTKEYEKLEKIPSTFTAISMETATDKNNSICSFGVAVVENNIIVESKSWLIRPPQNQFCNSNKKIHGITPEMTEKELSFRKLWKELEPYLNNKTIAAHYAHFGINILLKTCTFSQKNIDISNVLDSFIAAKRAYPKLENHKLITVCEHLNIPLIPNDSESKARACAEILLKIGKTPFMPVDYAIDETAYKCYLYNSPPKPVKVWEKTWNEKYGNNTRNNDNKN